MVIVTSYFQVSNLPILFWPGTSVCTQQHGLLPHHLIIHLFCWVFGSRYANFTGYVSMSSIFSYYFHLFLDFYGIFRACAGWCCGKASLPDYDTLQAPDGPREPGRNLATGSWFTSSIIQTIRVPSGYDPDTLWWTNIAMENHHAINGKIHYFYGHFQ